MEQMERLVSMYLDFAENMARRQVTMRMSDWEGKLDGFLRFNAYDVLDGFGTVSRVDAEQVAYREYEKFRTVQDLEYKSDFDQVVDAVKAKKKLPAPTE